MPINLWMNMQAPESLKNHRYTSYNFPSLRYIPGRGIHPSKMIGKEHIPQIPEASKDFSAERWQTSELYLYAIDLFNYCYYWEVHEVLEKLWHRIGKGTPEGMFIQGLIQLSVALLKNAQGNMSGVRRLTEKAFPKLSTQSGIYLGVNIQKLLLEFKYHIENNTAPPVITLNLK